MNTILFIIRWLSMFFLLVTIVLFSSTTYSRTPGEFFVDKDGDVGYILEEYIKNCHIHEDSGVTENNAEHVTNNNNTVKLILVHAGRYRPPWCVFRAAEKRDVETFPKIPGKLSVGEQFRLFWLQATIDYCFVLEESGITEDNYRGIENNHNTVEIILINSVKHGYICAVTGIEQLAL